MSDVVIKIIPTSPNYLPDSSSQNLAIVYLKARYPLADIQKEITDTTEFVDQGENFESVSCNLCGADIEIDFWQEKMDKAFESQFKDLTFTTKCCKKEGNLNELNYKTPAGFARFIIVIKNQGHEISEAELNEVEKLLHHKLRVITAVY